ncbi:uncharacterized protein CcaverHIS019_0600540 [Cutaneotrichosporon cavernicola]|uniref:ferric-chelate reductase (NADPH) n=1 Tax=Cutaneotrichosporon cavernicola TaxID=279322 RepID=A0AA48L7Y8_9TREE|nr:uncharacterized protein CcaverHIS019_0600540 [Cutaneotrichosporon cavernicola]BEI93595.1 hypothetical protein CcaverHIS019_0600540 [Cutaneotrichosporon cavernicola]BEJ01372.1 hypothetical protein CcaverHIS631_0600540 [Cutaneotrichosporon cavernicola]BEJ09139.1 hypothetical protein CcaverHIS641_0600540 [Cutaneotrichosporon cavernicola]
MPRLGFASVQPFGPGEERDRREVPRRVRSFAPHGGQSGNASGTATPITSGLGYHRSGPRTAAREVGGVVTWGGGGAPLFVKAGELFRDGEVDVVKRDGDVFVVEHYPLSDPSAPQMHDLHDDVEVDIADLATRDQVLGVVAAHRHETTEHDDDVADDEEIERVLSDHIQMLVVDDLHAVVAETAIIVEDEEVVAYSPSAPVGVLGPVSNPLPVSSSEDDDVQAMTDDDLFAVDTAGTSGLSEMADDDLFAVDTAGAASTVSILYDAPTQPPPAPKAPPKPTIDEETIIFQPRIIEDPIASSSQAPLPTTNFELTRVNIDSRVLNRKERKKAKREKRSRNKRARRQNGGGNGDFHLASDGSDLDWGSDGPPKILSVDAGDPVGDEELDPDLDDATLARYLAGTERIREDNAAMAYMESDSDEWEDEDMEETLREIAGRRDTDSEDDDDDDNESSENDFNALADAYSEDEYASDGEAKMFSGVTKWNDSDDEAPEVGDDNAWFIDKMEAALDGGAMAQSRKERNAVFRAVANGSFDGDFPLAPAKRNKKAPTHLPQELQDQWARDRAKKAEKKRDRELQRAIALLDPSIGFGRKANKKGKGKAAARIAHLIPGSAAEVAELFDISDDEGLGPDGGWGIKYHRSNPLLPPTLGDIDMMVQDFMSDSGRTTLQLPPMDKDTRKKVHMLAECYDLKSKSKGKGVGRFPILIKLARSGIDVDVKKRDRLVAAGQFNGGSFYKALYARKKGDKDKGDGKKFARGPGASVRAREGDLVGEGAEKIGQDNVGHQLLSKMGWSEGITIGLGGVHGLEAPIVAVVKNTKRGLGSYGMGYGAVQTTGKNKMAEGSTSLTGRVGSATLAVATSAVIETAKAARTSAPATNQWAPYKNKAEYKAAQKKVTQDAIFTTYYVIAGVAFGCLCLWAWRSATTYYYRRKYGKRTSQVSRERGLVSRASSAASATINNWAYVKVVPLWMFSNVTVAEWFWSAAYLGITLGIGFWGCYWQGKLDYANPMGFVAFGQIPILIALAGRNNTVSWITGISYEKLNYLHRTAGRVAVLTTWIHCFGYVHKGLGKHGPGSDVFMTGMLSGIAGLIMLLTSFALVRRIMYEFFLVVHITMCFIFIVAAWFHWPKLGWWPWTGLILWGFDRGVGFARMIFVNKAWLIPFTSKRDQHSACTVEIVDPTVLRITVANRNLTWSPGQHALLTMPQVATLRYEQHPFTMASASGDAVFLVRAQGGFTARLLDRTQSQTETGFNCYIEGPYGMSHHSELLGHDTLLLVCGGTGITYGCSNFLGAIAAAQQSKTSLSSLRLVWNVREAAHIEWIAPLLNAALEKGTGGMTVSIDIYVTRSGMAEGHSIEEGSGEDSGTTTPEINSSTEAVDKVATPSVGEKGMYGLTEAAMRIVTFHKGRSPVETILRKDTAGSTTNAAGVAVGMCGPLELQLDTRRAICRVNSASKILKGQPPIVLHVENFGW